MKIAYNNEYGNLEFELFDIEGFREVGEISSENIDNNLFFDIDIAEQIALITQNVRVQVGFVFPTNGKAYLIYHQSSNMGAVCKITKLEFTSKVNPTEEIEYLAKTNKSRELAWIEEMKNYGY